MVGFLMRKIDNRKLMITGILLCAAASLMMSDIDLQVAQSSFALANLVQGMGLALAFVPLATTTMGLLRNDQMGNATGLFNLMRNLGGGIGISLVTTMIARGSQAHQATLVTHLTPYDPAFQSTLQSIGAALAPQVGAAQAQAMASGSIYSSLIRQSTLLAYVDDFRWLALLSFIALPVVFFLKRISAKGSVSVH
jgi:DHA2 family multidrug resistance protein